MQTKGVDRVRHGYGPENVGSLPYHRENPAGTFSVLAQFMCCSLASFAFISKFWQQFGSLVACFFPRSVLNPILTVKKRKNSHLVVLHHLDFLCLQGTNQSCVVFFFFFLKI